MKICAKCKQEKDFSEFHANKRMRTGYGSYCKSCHNEIARERNRLNPRQKTEWLNSKFDNEEDRKRYILNANLKTNYGMTLLEYEQMLYAQGGRCAICDNPPIKERLLVDHDHNCCPGTRSCGKCVRGLLCRDCNTGIARFKDTPRLLDRAKAYLIN